MKCILTKPCHYFYDMNESEFSLLLNHVYTLLIVIPLVLEAMFVEELFISI